MPTPRILRGKTVAQAEIYDLAGSLSEAIGMFKEWDRLHGNHGSPWMNLRIELDGPDYEGPTTIVLLGDRQETSEELATRRKRKWRRNKRQ